MKNIYFLVVALFFYGAGNAQIVNIPDASFKIVLVASNSTNQIAKDLSGNFFKIDANSNGEIEVSEAQQVSVLYVSTSIISNLIGISDFINLRELYCFHNQITSLNLSSNLELRILNCLGNQITSLNLNSNLELRSLTCYENQLTSLDLNNNVNLTDLLCWSNQLTSLNLINNVNLSNLDCDSNQLTSLNLSNNVNLTQLYCHSNQLTSLNLSNNVNLNGLYCYNNFLTSLNLKNGKNESDINFFSNPNLQYICADDNQIQDVQSKITTYGYTNCQVNSYCTFTAGGTFYTIQGNQKFDADNNGCDALDNPLSNLKLNILSGSNNFGFVTNNSGSFNVAFANGTYSITPIFENPTYFNISPTNVVVTFPTQTSPVTQDFCVTANGSHPDLEINLLPIAPARPGFDSIYKLIFKNKGNTIQSGTVNLSFNDSVLDLVAALPTATTQTLNNLTWDFSNLQPLETREITFTFNVNSPMETPAINGGDVLNYVATITSTATDETPNDNTFAFDQTVVNSYDPNDKTCLEGATISQTKVGDFVHYMIRFENTGTFPAQNIVVKDIIDTTKFDINSIVPIKGSHSFVTNITAGKKVEFIFENINLPFENATNDGYIVFKIKTKSTLVIGDSFSNTASIYFDYNFPIITNTTTTTIQTLGNQDFEFESYFSFYPNPVKDVLTLDFKQTIEVKSINIYNTLGQLVLIIPKAQNTNNIDVSSLKSGNYFIKINSDKGTSNSKFIKL